MTPSEDDTPATADAGALTPDDVAHVQRRTVRVLAAGQVLAAVAFGATVSLGALLASEISGEESLSGFATAALTLGAAVCAIPLATLASRRGRRISLTLGNIFALLGISVVILAAALSSFPLLLGGILMIGAGNAGNLQSRFAATDLAPTSRRARDLSVVVWAAAIGGVVGPLLLGPGEMLGAAIGMPEHTGAYLFSLAAQAGAFVLYVIALRPDPLLTAQRLSRRAEARREHIVETDVPRVARYAIFAVAASHAVMASVMAMTPVHLTHVVATNVTVIIGVTIALHVGGMYGLAPVFGILADRLGRLPVILAGQVMLAVSLTIAAIWGQSQLGVVFALILLGLGWSASTVAGAALLTESTATVRRPRRQGVSDSLMSLSAAVGAVLAGIILGWIGYGGLALFALVLVAAVAFTSPLGVVHAPAKEPAA